MRTFMIAAIGAITLIACGSVGDSDRGVAGASSVSTPTVTRNLQEWRTAMSKTPVPTEGCFRTSQPGTTWEEVPCGTTPVGPRPIPARLLSPARVATAPGATPPGGHPHVQHVVNGLNDYNASVPGLLTSTEGSFPSETGGTNESDDNAAATNPGTNSYSLQMNTSLFVSPACSTSTNSSCRGWEQLIYDPQTQQAYFEFSLVDYVGNCPQPFVSSYPAGSAKVCYFNSASSSVPAVAAANLTDVAMLGATNATTDTLTMVVNGKAYALSQPSVLGLANGWNDAEFNVYGEDNGTQASFNSPTALVVQIVTTLATPTRSAPACPSSPTTGWGTVESNTLSLVGSCCPFGGDVTGIQFMESNVSGATARSCPLTAAPVAFQATTGDLWTTQNGASENLQLGMMNGTTPSLATLPSGELAMAFQANTGDLWLAQNGVGANQFLGMMAGTSPSIAVLPDGEIAIAFQANTGDLWLEQNGVGENLGLGMMRGTSPSVAVLSNGQLAVAFQANTGDLWVEQNGSGQDQRLGMWPGTSPSIAALPTGGWDVAFQANTGDLWIDESTDAHLAIGYGRDQGLGMRAGTSPSIGILLLSGASAVAFQANTGALWVVENGTGENQNLGMSAGASPTIVPLANGGYQIAFEANTGNLWLDVNGFGTNQNLGMNTP
jgi:hypothetical protein